MDHEAASSLLADLALGRLQGRESEPAWTHVAGCSECQQVLATMHGVRSAAREEERLRAEHPSADTIVRYAHADADLGVQELASLALHLDACERCRNEVALTRGASRHASRPLGALAWLGSWRERTWTTAPRWLALAPALGALVLLLGYPAYLGVIELPKARDTAQRASEELATERAREPVRDHPPTPIEPPSGGARMLYLGASLRDGADPPSVGLLAGQAVLPIMVSHDLGELARRRPEEKLQITLRRSDGVIVWQHEETAARLWDPAQQVILFVAPTTGLTPSEYQLEVRRFADRALEYRGRFRVRA